MPVTLEQKYVVPNIRHLLNFKTPLPRYRLSDKELIGWSLASITLSISIY
jgi:hypothetical protein